MAVKTGKVTVDLSVVGAEDIRNLVEEVSASVGVLDKPSTGEESSGPTGEMEYKTTGGIFTKEVDEGGNFEGYGAALGNKDYYNDIIVAGAFIDTIRRHNGKGPSVKMLWQHNTEDPIGIWGDMLEDKKGLLVAGKLNLGVQRGKEAYVLMKSDEKGRRALDGLSIGFETKKFERDNDSGIRRLTLLEVWEVSPVTFPANPKARIGRVKNLETIRELEHTLRDAGFSLRDARAIASNGWKGLTQRDVDVETLNQLASVVSAVREMSNTLRG